MAKKKIIRNNEAIEWINSRPRSVQERIKQYPPEGIYELIPTGQIVHIYSYSEDSDTGQCTTCTVYMLPEENIPTVVVPMKVFDIEFKDLKLIDTIC